MFGMNEKEIKLKTKRYILMRKYDGSTDFYQERAFDNKDYADEYARLMVKQEAGYTYYLFEQSKDYQEKELEQEVVKEQEDRYKYNTIEEI